MIITARLNPEAQQMLNQLREDFFPKERNFIDAHLTLFHNVPEGIVQHLPKLHPPLNALLGNPFFLGFGFAIEVRCPELDSWRKQVLELPFDFTPQDQRHKKLHVTIQNKVESSLAKEDFKRFSLSWGATQGTIEGLDFWRYLNGPWESMGSTC
jgi:hypothetical protein